MADSLQISIQSGKEGGLMYLRGRLNIESSPALRDHLLVVLRRQSPQQSPLTWWESPIWIHPASPL
jgi:hypothetical protein